MSYKVGHVISSERSKCVVCGKRVSDYVSINNYTKDGFGSKVGTAIEIPCCDGLCREKVCEKKEIFIAYAKNINNLFKAVEQ